MGGSSSKSKNNSNNMASNESWNNYTNQNQFDQSVYGPQSSALQTLYNNAQSLFGSNNAQMQGQIPRATQFAGNTASQASDAWQKMLQGGAYAGVDSAAIQKQLQDSMGQPSNQQEINNMIMGGSGNNYADAMKGQYMKDAQLADDMMMSNLDARLGGTGMGTSTRAGVAEGIGRRGINDALQANLTRTGYETFDKDLDRKLGIASSADANTLARQQMMQGMLGQKQAAMSGGLAGSGDVQNLGMGTFAPLMMPWQGLQNYASTIGGPTVLNKGYSSGYGGGSSFGTSRGASAGKGSAASGGVGGGKVERVVNAHIEEDANINYLGKKEYGSFLQNIKVAI